MLRSCSSAVLVLHFVNGCGSGNAAPTRTEPPQREHEASCFPDERADPLRAWSSHFPVERGGMVALLKGDAKVALEVQSTVVSLDLRRVQTKSCEDLLAVWVPGVTPCPPAALLGELGRTALVLRTSCFRPLSMDEVAKSCKAGSIPNERCDLAQPSP